MLQLLGDRSLDFSSQLDVQGSLVDPNGSQNFTSDCNMMDDMMQGFGDTAGRLTPQILPLPLNLPDSQDLFASHDASGTMITANGQTFEQWSPNSDYNFSANFGEENFPGGAVIAQDCTAFEEWDSVMLEEDAGHSLQITSCGHVKYMGNTVFTL